MRLTQLIRHLLSISLYAAGTVFLTCVGCSDPKPTQEKEKHKLPMAKHGNSALTGKITYKGEPIQAGRLFFLTSDKQMVPELGIIHGNGTFHAKGLPSGELHVCVFLDPDGPYPFPLPPPGMEPPELRKTKPEGLHVIPRTPSTDAQIEPKEPSADDGTDTGKVPPEVVKGGPKKDPRANKGGPSKGRKTPAKGDQGRGAGPPTLPGYMLKNLKDYQMPSGKEATYKELHKKFSFPGEENPLRVTLSPGENKLDIELDAKPLAGE